MAILMINVCLAKTIVLNAGTSTIKRQHKTVVALKCCFSLLILNRTFYLSCLRLTITLFQFYFFVSMVEALKWNDSNEWDRSSIEEDFPEIRLGQGF